MILQEDSLGIFLRNGLDFFTGVPDSTLKGLISCLQEARIATNTIASNECEAVAIATGYHLATGKIGVVYMQNSGLGKAVNPLTSLVSKEVYSIPMVLLVGWRGVVGEKDEPQHKMMGRIMPSLLDVLEIPYKPLPASLDEAVAAVGDMKEFAERINSPVSLVVRKGTFEEKPSFYNENTFIREKAIDILLDKIDGNSLVVSTTGFCSRELFEARKRREEQTRDFYTVGSMGCCAAIGHSIALAKSEKDIYVFDGDGAALMELGSWATIGHYKPKNFHHIVFDNNAYDSTGGQRTVSDSVDFGKIALACGYNRVNFVDSEYGLKGFYPALCGPEMLVVRVEKGARKELGRPTSTPLENKKVFVDFLTT